MTGYSFEAERMLRNSQAHSNASDATAVATAGVGYAVMTLANELRQLVAAQAPAAPTVVYRAYFEAMPLGLYATRDAARAHCLADAKSHGDDITGANWWPNDQDDPEGSAECLVLKGPKCGDLMTDYSVMPLTVAAAYDPDAEA